MKHSPDTGKQLSFLAILENWAEGMDYCTVAVPAEITQTLGTKGPVLVSAQVNDSALFQVSLFPVGGGRHYVRIKARVRQETETKVGDQVHFRFTVLDRADITVPEDLMSALREKGATKAFELLPHGKQSFMIRRLDSAAKLETREKRIQEIVDAARQRKEKVVARP